MHDRRLSEAFASHKISSVQEIIDKYIDNVAGADDWLTRIIKDAGIAPGRIPSIKEALKKSLKVEQEKRELLTIGNSEMVLQEKRGQQTEVRCSLNALNTLSSYDIQNQSYSQSTFNHTPN